MSAQIINMGLVFVIIQAANRFEVDKPENVPYVRLAYAATQLIQFAVMAYIFLRVKAQKDMTPLTYTEPKNPMDPADVDVVTTTVEGYDKKQVMSQLYQYAIGIGMISLMHFKWGYIRPLTLQAVLGLKALFELPLVKVHILGQQSVGALARPWKPKSLFGDAAATSTPTVKEKKAQDKKDQKKKLNRYD